MKSIAKYLINEELDVIPFIQGVISYSKKFEDQPNLVLPNNVKNILRGKLLEELSFTSEVTFQQELDRHIQNGNNDFDQFVKKIKILLISDYPFLNEILKRKAENFSKHLSKIVSRFQKDRKNIISTFGINTKPYNLKIVDIDAGIGDGHNGEGTALIYLSDGTKLIYKPRNISITNSYNSFINWVNNKLKTDLKIFKVLDCEEYGWLEFIVYEEVNSEKDLQEYYYKAGILLAITLLLGGKDYHHENVIASGKNPVLIDHETIIQPFFSNKSFLSWDDKFKIPQFSVLESNLIVNPNGAPLDIVGFGVRGNIEVTELEKKVTNPNTINSKRTTCFTKREIIDKNIPVFDGIYVFVNDYKEYFSDGFSIAYDIFVNSKEELKSDSSPLDSFKNNEVRYVWRPTFVYFKILKYMRAPSFIASFEAYYSKLYDLLSKAYKGENIEEYKYILDFEMKQMLNGDIPIFSLNSLDNFLEGKEALKIFEYSCIENINHRIDLLSPEHKNEQLEYITRWANM
jgi:type 2 lantibiotic biosynthesis protein LanM